MWLIISLSKIYLLAVYISVDQIKFKLEAIKLDDLTSEWVKRVSNIELG